MLRASLTREIAELMSQDESREVRELWLLPTREEEDDCPRGSVVEHSLGKGEVARSIRAEGTNDWRSGRVAEGACLENR